MAYATIEVTYRREELSRIPDNLREGVALLLLLWRGGLDDAIGARVRIHRSLIGNPVSPSPG